MDYKQALEGLRQRLFSSESVEAPRKTASFVPVREGPSDQRDSSDIVSQSQDWLRQVRASSEEAQRKVKSSFQEFGPSGETSSIISPELVDKALKKVGLKKETPETEKTEEVKASQEEGFVKRPSGGTSLGEASSKASPGYGDISQKAVEDIIRIEAESRNIDPNTAIKIFRSEGRGSYQSQIARSGKGSAGGKEASYGPFQLYTGDGLGSQYEELTGRSLATDNTMDGITNQVRFALDMAVDQGWAPWYGRKHVGVGVKDGLAGAKKLKNWGQ